MLMVVLVGLSLHAPGRDLYASIQEGHLLQVDKDEPTPQTWKFRATVHTKTKLEHALRREKFKVGIFGNSYSWSLRGADFGVPEDDFFNFSIQASVRGIVRMMEELARHGKLPELSIFYLDHMEVQIFSNSDYPNFPARFSNAVGDLYQGLRQGAPAKSLVRMASRHARDEWRRFTWMMSRHQFIQSALLFAGVDPPQISAAVPESVGYRRDGSRAGRTVFAGRGDGPPALLPSYKPNILPHYLAYDIERIGALNAPNQRIVILESFVHARNTRIYQDNPSDIAIRSREAYLKTCARMDTTCARAPTDMETVRGPAPYLRWPTDAKHPPNELIVRQTLDFLASRKVPLPIGPQE